MPDLRAWETPLLPFSWLAVQRPHYGWSHCKRHELAGVHQSSGHLPEKVWGAESP